MLGESATDHESRRCGERLLSMMRSVSYLDLLQFVRLLADVCDVCFLYHPPSKQPARLARTRLPLGIGTLRLRMGSELADDIMVGLQSHRVRIVELLLGLDPLRLVSIEIDPGQIRPLARVRLERGNRLEARRGMVMRLSSSGCYRQ